MKENLRKYAQLLLKRCLCLNHKRPLLVTAPIKAIDFIEVLTHEAYQLGINDIYFDWYDDDLKHEQLLHLSDEELVKSPFWNKVIYDEYAKKNAAFLMLCSDDIDLMNDIPEEKITLTIRHNRASSPLFREMQRVDEVPWCIAMVSTEISSKKVFPNDENSKDKLWDEIFKACLVNKDDPLTEWDKKTDNNK